jgi:hypothetical protein
MRSPLLLTDGDCCRAAARREVPAALIVALGYVDR